MLRPAPSVQAPGRRARWEARGAARCLPHCRAPPGPQRGAQPRACSRTPPGATWPPPQPLVRGRRWLDSMQASLRAPLTVSLRWAAAPTCRRWGSRAAARMPPRTSLAALLLLRTLCRGRGRSRAAHCRAGSSAGARVPRPARLGITSGCAGAATHRGNSNDDFRSAEPLKSHNDRQGARLTYSVAGTSWGAWPTVTWYQMTTPTACSACWTPSAG